jgi:low affinity Fe/Cu permease
MQSKASQKKSSQAEAEESARPNGRNGQGIFSRAACAFAHLAGRPVTFLAAAGLVIVWAMSGPFFGFSDTWQLVINTSTTIVTFLMVFLIQNTQNRDTSAIQIKLAELILRLDGADNKLATAEDLSDEELERLHRQYKQRAETMQESLDRRRGGPETRAHFWQTGQ